MDDAQLVDAARAGDREAIAAIYDRYADGIHDFCLSILRNQAEAADALQETFLVAFEGLHTLAEPARLRAWLYALAHRSLLDRIEHYGASFFSDEGELRDLGPSDERLSRPQLAEFVGAMAAGLDLGDRVLLDLHLRQGLEGRDLAGASGAPAAQLPSRLARLEAQVDRSLGALIVARTARRNCPELYGILDRDDARLTPEFRAEITAHVDECERCNPRRRIAPSALELLAAAPAAAAPPYLRSVALGKAEMAGVQRESGPGIRGSRLARLGWAFQRDGFPVLAAGAAGARRPAPATLASPPPTVVVADRITDPKGTPTTYLPGIAGGAVPPGELRSTGWAPGDVPPGALPPTVVAAGALPPERRHDRLGMLVGALAGLIVLVVAAVVLLRPGKKAAPVAVVATTTVSPAATSTVFTPTTIFTLPTTTVPPTTVAVNGHLVVAAKSLDLGVSATTISMQFGNDGTAPLNFNAVAIGTGLT
ncbi:MAG TPA: sigma factor, partial [Acidimicrobiales bacterium]|nr:sigma factor [Acidimicrobiales bacterium]